MKTWKFMFSTIFFFKLMINIIHLVMSDLLCVFIVEMESVVGEVSTQLLELARRQRMNTDVRKNIFCVIMSSQVCVREY